MNKYKKVTSSVDTYADRMRMQISTKMIQSAKAKILNINALDDIEDELLMLVGDLDVIQSKLEHLIEETKNEYISANGSNKK